MLELITCNCRRVLCGDDCQCRIFSSVLEIVEMLNIVKIRKMLRKTVMVKNKGTMSQKMMIKPMSISRMEKIWNDL